MKQILLLLAMLTSLVVVGQRPVRIVSAPESTVAAAELQRLLALNGIANHLDGTIHVGDTPLLRERYSAQVAQLRDDGYLICGDGREVCLYGLGDRGTLYAVYAFLEKLGYRLYTSDALHVPALHGSPLSSFTFQLVENPAFSFRETLYYYPNHSELYANWHRLHNRADLHRQWGMFVHTFQHLIPADKYYDQHPEWFSMREGRRDRDGQLCLANREVLEELCRRLADTMSRRPEATVWSVSNNDNYNACQCAECLQLDSLYGGPTGTLIHFINQVARRFPDKVISTLAYQYTRCAPKDARVKPDANVNIMFCSIECGREESIATSAKEASFRKDMEDWGRICAIDDATQNSKFKIQNSKIFLWDYVVQFRNFWNPFPNLHVLQPNLQYFRDHSVRMMFEQATGADNLTSWMDIRCYMLAKLMWNPDLDMDSVMDDFFRGYYGPAAPFVRRIIDTMTAALVASGKTLNIYGFPIDGADGYLSPQRMLRYDLAMQSAYSVVSGQCSVDSAVLVDRLRYFELALDFATVELMAAGRIKATPDQLTARLRRMTSDLKRFGVPQMMEMGISPDEYERQMLHFVEKTQGTLRPRKLIYKDEPTAPYNSASLVDRRAGIMDYRADWVGFWGDTLKAVVELASEPVEVESVSMDFYFYPLSWIFLPQRVAYDVSFDGKRWRRVGEWRPENPEILATPDIKTFRAEVGSAVRYVRVVAEPIPEIPSWHRAAGQKAWIFSDEVVVK